MTIKNILEKISLSDEEEEELKEVADEVVKKIKGGFVGGSLAKGTLVKKGVQDIDIFVVFDSEEETRKLESILKKVGLHGKKLHGSRDYFQIKENEFIVEIVPVVKFREPEEVKNVVDFSLKHVDYIRKRIGKDKKIADEIKLAKVFCYANECYGAESYISGFSGYALELLVICFGSFMGFLKKIQKKRVIDIEKDFKNENEIRMELNESKLQSPIILIDPVYKFRNVCAGLSDETFNKFLKAAKLFLKKPNEKFFVKKEFDFNDLLRDTKKKKGKLLELRFETDRQEGDIAGTKMKKFFKYLIKEFEEKGQSVLRGEFYYNKGQEAEGYLIVRPVEIIEIKGPAIENKNAVKNFKRVRKKVYEKNGFLWAKEKVKMGEILEKVRKTGEEMGVGFSVI